MTKLCGGCKEFANWADVVKKQMRKLGGECEEQNYGCCKKHKVILRAVIPEPTYDKDGYFGIHVKDYERYCEK